MIRKEKNTLIRLLAQTKVCSLNWILFNNSKLIISNPVLKINDLRAGGCNEKKANQNSFKC
ncbi:hypothetical protein HV819_05610 [Anaerococcus sp. AGMB00486]|uniref:Uncharacterized protein n=2 Tax=Anaerococcus TaxID=165779 RepID=A0ABX2NA56_9FIRM|nr:MULTISPECIES: hypothetical protein [Anaerococcus]MDY3007322.1 hypothetical protein [Anaerococcus porci]MSS78551.1 hypothetical protein [Anaerococcus porci]NVF11459.1 hypothetical protein [Anaerococcus faecalis]